MMMKNKLLVVILILLIASVAYLFFLNTSKPKVGYVDIKELYSGFEMKKQMEQTYLKAKGARDKELDNLKFELNSLLKKIDAEKEKNSITKEEFEKKKAEFFQKKNQFEEENEKLSKQYDQEILVQLNQYVKDFGTKHQYKMLLGNDGNGSLMYATEELNCTKAVLTFVNDEYNGIK